MYTITLNQEDFKEEVHWITLCDSLDVPNTSKEVLLEVDVINYH